MLQYIGNGRPTSMQLHLAVVSILFFVIFFCLWGKGGEAHVIAVFLPLSPIASTLVCLVDLSVKSFVFLDYFVLLNKFYLI